MPHHGMALRRISKLGSSGRLISTTRLSPERPDEQGFSEKIDFDNGQDGDWTEQQPLNEAEKKALLRQMIRANILSEVAAAKLAKGLRCTDQKRPDLHYRQEREKELLKKAESLAGPHRAKPSLLRPVVSAAGLGLGAISSVLPQSAAAAIAGGLQEAMVEQYNDQLRELRQNEMSEASTAFRDTIRELRDEERATPEAVQAPDLMKLQRPQELSSEEILAGVVKYGMKGLFSLGSKV